MNNIYRESGIKRDVKCGTNKRVELKVKNDIYCNEYIGLGKTDKCVIAAVLMLIENDMNTIFIGGDTLDELSSITGYNAQTIRDSVVRLSRLFLLERTSVRGEYIVNPLFAVKGNEKSVWDVYGRINNERSIDGQ